MPEAPLLICFCIEGRAIWSGVSARRTAGASGLIHGGFNPRLAPVPPSFHEMPGQCSPFRMPFFDFSKHTMCEYIQEKYIGTETPFPNSPAPTRGFVCFRSRKLGSNPTVPRVRPHTSSGQTPQKWRCSRVKPHRISIACLRSCSRHGH